MNTQKCPRVCMCLLIAVFGLMAGACATMQARSTNTSGFLGDYSQLKEGGDGKALLVYIDPQADIKSYKSILMDPVKLYASAENSLDGCSFRRQHKILNYADASIREHLAKDYVFVQQPGPGVMRLRFALTETDSSYVVLDTVSTILPIGLALGGLQTLQRVVLLCRLCGRRNRAAGQPDRQAPCSGG